MLSQMPGLSRLHAFRRRSVRHLREHGMTDSLERHRELTVEEVKQIARAMEQLSKNECHVCGAAIVQQEQVGHCVYARPCGHRLYQGEVGAFAPQLKAGE